MSDSKRIKQGRAKRVYRTSDLVRWLRANSATNDVKSVLRNLDRSLGSESREKRERQEEEQKQRLLENPAWYFEIEKPCRNEAWLAFCGPQDRGFGKYAEKANHWLSERDWNEVARYCGEIETGRLSNTGLKKQAISLVQPGLVWRYGDILVGARKKSLLYKHAPDDAVSMIFVHEGAMWEPSSHLCTLAEIKLHIPTSSLASGGRPEDEFRLSIVQKRQFAEFLAGTGDEALVGAAKAQLHHCDVLLRAFDEASDVSCITSIASASNNAARGNLWLRILSDSAMLRDNRFAYHFQHHSNPPAGEDEVDAAVKAIAQVTGQRATREEVIQRTKATRMKVLSARKNEKVWGFRINSADMTEREFFNSISRANKRHADHGKKPPMGRPRKKVSGK
jgi:hypothetical protein